MNMIIALFVMVIFITSCEGPVGPIGPKGSQGIQGETGVQCELIIPSVTGTWLNDEVVGGKKAGIVFFNDNTALVGYLIYKDKDFLGHIPLHNYTYNEDEKVGYLKQGDDFYTTGKKFSVISDSLFYEGKVYTKEL